MSSDNNDQFKEENDEIFYRGSTIPVFLRLVYVTFIVWAVFYFVSYSFPDLKIWLEK